MILVFVIVLEWIPVKALGEYTGEPTKIIEIIELNDEVKNQTYHVGEDVNVVLPEELSVQIQETPCDFACEESHLEQTQQETINEARVAVVWTLEGDSQFSTESPKTYQYHPELVNKELYVLADNVKLPEITVNVVDNPSVSASPVEEPLASALPVENPPASAPPVEDPPASAPPVEDPPASTPPSSQVFDVETEDMIKQIEDYLNTVRPLHDNMNTLRQAAPSKQLEINNFVEGEVVNPKYYKIVCIDSIGEHGEYNETTPREPVEIRVGEIQNSAPQTIWSRYSEAEEYLKHFYVASYVKDMHVTHIGQLEVEGTEYGYYVVEGASGSLPTYTVLKPDEKVALRYTHADGISVEYKFQTEGVPAELSPDNKTISDVFGHDRQQILSHGENLGIELEILRGYTAELSVTPSEGGEAIYQKTIGEMPTYQRVENHVVFEEGSVEVLKLDHVASILDVQKDLVVTLNYKKIKEFTFDIFKWYETIYANLRIQRIFLPGGWREPFINDKYYGGKHHYSNSIVKMDYTKEDPFGEHGFAFVTTPHDSEWEMDQFEINNEIIKVPHINMEKDPGAYTSDYVWETTTLSSGTIIKLGVRSANVSKWGGGGDDAKNSGWKRVYKIEVQNCYENLTVTAGNMVGIRHREIVLNTSQGIGHPQAFTGFDETTGEKVEPKAWDDVSEEVLLNRRQRYHYSDPIRVGRGFGYQYVNNVTLTTKEGEMLQHNEAIHEGTVPLIEYLVVKDGVEYEGDAPKPTGIGGSGDYHYKGKIYTDDTFEVVAFKDWKASKDGYWYLRGTQALDTMQRKVDYGVNPRGALLLTLSAPTVKGGLDYQNGGGRVNEAGEPISPPAENIVNIPTYQNGGKNGYNIIDNQEVLVSGKTPVDVTGEYVFDYWVLLATVTDEQSPYGRLLDVPYKEEEKEFHFHPNDSMHIIHDFFSGSLANALYYNLKEDRGTATLRAVWKKRGSSTTDLIPYTTNVYITSTNKSGYLQEQKILAHINFAEEGTKIISDLYATDGAHKVLSDNLKNILTGNNPQGLTYQGDWIINEERSRLKIEHLTITDNIINIYLVDNNLPIKATKEWVNALSPPTSIQVKLQKQDEAIWHDTSQETLSSSNQWTATFGAKRYPTNGVKITGEEYTYRVMELDESGNPVENEGEVRYNGNLFKATYEQEENSSNWKITNTALTADLTITKRGVASIDENQSFVFHVQGEAGTPTEGISLTIVINQKDDWSVTINTLPIGNYTIKEQTNWSWRYDPTQPVQTVSILDGTVIFENTRNRTHWLSGSSWCDNRWNGSGITQKQDHRGSLW